MPTLLVSARRRPIPARPNPEGRKQGDGRSRRRYSSSGNHRREAPLREFIQMGEPCILTCTANAKMQVQQYAENTSTCRHISICRFFGEKIDHNDAHLKMAYCGGMCDVGVPDMSLGMFMPRSASIRQESGFARVPCQTRLR